jgi:preprotein translocase subunit SecG
MYILISIFYISLVGIITMILLKRREVKSSIPSTTNSAIERSLSKFFGRIQYSINFLNKKTFVALVQFVTFHVLYRIRKVYVEIKHRTLLNPHGKKMIDAVRGRGEVKNHGASFYLRRISDR